MERKLNLIEMSNMLGISVDDLKSGLNTTPSNALYSEVACQNLVDADAFILADQEFIAINVEGKISLHILIDGSRISCKAISRTLGVRLEDIEKKINITGFEPAVDPKGKPLYAPWCYKEEDSYLDAVLGTKNNPTETDSPAYSLSMELV